MSRTIKNLFYVLGITILLLGSFFSVAKAQYSELSTSEALIYESVVSFSSIISVNTDNSVGVEEAIKYNTGGVERHGLYRDIYPYSAEGTKMSIGNVSVADESGISYQFQILNVNGNVRIKIGDPSKTFTGQKTYVIKYKATKAVSHLKDIDEIYWNVTGNNWEIPIYTVTAKVLLPKETSAIQSACYFGYKGSVSRCDMSNVISTSFSTAGVLGPSQGMTVAIGFPKGIVLPYTAKDNVNNFILTYLPWFIAGLLPFLTFIIMFWYWYNKGRDPKGTGVIVPQYDVPEGLTPMEVSGIIRQDVSSKEISAEIIYLATKGYITIRQTEDDRLLGLIKKTDYEITKVKDFSDLPNDFDRTLLAAIFDPQAQALKFARLLGNNPSQFSGFLGSLFNSLKKSDQFKMIENEISNTSNTTTINLSDLKNKFYTNIPLITKGVVDGLLVKGYYKNLGSMKSKGGIWIAVSFSAWLFLYFGHNLGSFIFEHHPMQIIGSLAASLIIYIIFTRISPAKTEHGVATKEYLLGLKQYLQIAEKDRLEFHNAPEKRPEVFEKLLPYAMVLGVADIWAKEFEGIYTTPPSWYSGSHGAAFSAVAFNHSISNFSSFTSSSLSSSPSSGGSGGGGSSGGGGGGGGGGGW